MLQLYTLLLGETGMRCNSEALWLRWEDVDLGGGFLEIRSGREGRRTKSGKSRWVPMSPRLCKAMQAHFASYRFASYHGKPSEYVFHHVTSDGNRVAGQRATSLYGPFKAAAERAGLSKALRQHDLRHRRATTWLGAGKSAVLVKEALGHSDLRTTMSYTHLVRDDLRALVTPAQPVDAPTRQAAVR